MAPERPIAEAVPGADKAGDARRVVSSKLSVLRKQPIFCDLDPEALDQLCRYAKHSSLKRGATIVSKGDPGNSLIAVVSGTVKIIISSPDARTPTLNLLAPSDLLEEPPSLLGAPRLP